MVLLKHNLQLVSLKLENQSYGSQYSDFGINTGLRYLLDYGITKYFIFRVVFDDFQIWISLARHTFNIVHLSTPTLERCYVKKYIRFPQQHVPKRI